MKPKIKSDLSITVHRDGTVSYWNCLSQTWERQEAVSIADDVLATLNDTERRRIARAVGSRPRAFHVYTDAWSLEFEAASLNEAAYLVALGEGISCKKENAPKRLVREYRAIGEGAFIVVRDEESMESIDSREGDEK